MLRWIDRWCKQGTGITTAFLGNISAILMADIALLPLISDSKSKTIKWHNDSRILMLSSCGCQRGRRGEEELLTRLSEKTLKLYKIGLWLSNTETLLLS